MSGSDKLRRYGPGILVATLLVAGAVTWGITSQGPQGPARSTESDEIRESTPARPAVAGAPAGAPEAHTGAQEASLPSRPRSPLERSPGYYPPDDPESLSVVTGRRDAPLVDLELTGAAPSMDQLARMILAALNQRDEPALHALRVNREEFEVILWREFPESRPVTNITAEDAWQASSANSMAGTSRGVGQYGARNLEFLRVESTPPTTYKNFSLHRGVQILARDPATGREERVHFAPTFVERHGRYKVLLYKD